MQGEKTELYEEVNTAHDRLTQAHYLDWYIPRLIAGSRALSRSKSANSAAAKRTEVRCLIIATSGPIDDGILAVSSAFLPFSPLFVFIDYDLLDHTLYIEGIKVFMKETTVGDLIDHWGGCEVSDLSNTKNPY